MRHPERIEDYLEHILDAIDRATDYLRPLPDFEAFRVERMVQDAVIRNIEIIGEAANKINKTSPKFLIANAHIPWAEMRAMRNLIAHEYFFVDLRIIWTTVHGDLPKLRRQIGDLLDQLRREREPDPSR